jgi:hypothetical protein
MLVLNKGFNAWRVRGAHIKEFNNLKLACLEQQPVTFH